MIEMNKNDKSLRIQNHPFLELDKGKKIEIYFDKKKIIAYEKETIGGALYASGIKVLARSLKYHRPRGLFCMSGKCPNCLMRVNGTPMIRVCDQTCKEGDQIKGENSWPSLKNDIFSISDKIGFMFPIGFQYKYLIKPKFLFSIWINFLRKMAGYGKIPDKEDTSEYSQHSIDKDVLIIGSGPAGISTAMSLSKSNLKVGIVDENNYLGGHLKYQTQIYNEPEVYAGMRGIHIADKMANDLIHNKKIEVFLNSVAFGLYDKEMVTIHQENTLLKIKAKKIVIATGSQQRPIPFINNDLPGIFLGSGIQKLMHLDGVKPGHNTVVICEDDSGYIITDQLLDSGIKVKALIDLREKEVISKDKLEKLEKMKIPIYISYKVIKAHGKKSVSGITISDSLDVNKKLKIKCDSISMSGVFTPTNELLFQATYKGSYILESPVNVVKMPNRDEKMRVDKNIYVVGDVTQKRTLDAAIIEGQVAGESIIKSINNSQKRN